jgi:hypothetical protein
MESMPRFFMGYFLQVAIWTFAPEVRAAIACFRHFQFMLPP